LTDAPLTQITDARPESARRLVQLDWLRGLAIVLVLGRHMTPCPWETSHVMWAVTSVWQRGGWVGVDLFFVLSGFLISGLLFREYQVSGRVDLRRFLIRRGFKIYPPFWAMIGMTVYVTWPIRRPGFAGEMLFLQNYMGGLWDHTWSLAVEEHFYLLLAALVWWLTRPRHGARSTPFAVVPWVFVGVAIICLSLRFMTARWPYAHETHLFPTHLRIHSLMFGVLLSYWWHFGTLAEWGRRPRVAPVLCTTGAALLAPAFVFTLEATPWISVIGLTLFYLASGALLLGVLSFQVPDTRVVRAAGWIGVSSYSIYLWHMPVQWWGVPVAEALLGHSVTWATYAGLYLVGAVLVGVLAAKAIEYPVLHVRELWYPPENALMPAVVASTRSVPVGAPRAGEG